MTGVQTCALPISDRRRDDGEVGVEEEEEYLIGETDPFIAGTSEGWECEDSDWIGFPLDVIIGSVEVRIPDRPEMLFTDERDEAPVEPRTVLKGKLELYMFTVDLGDVGVVIVIADLSGTDPVPGMQGVLVVNDDASPLIDTGSVPVRLAEDIRLADTWMGYWAC